MPRESEGHPTTPKGRRQSSGRRLSIRVPGEAAQASPAAQSSLDVASAHPDLPKEDPSVPTARHRSSSRVRRRLKAGPDTRSSAAASSTVDTAEHTTGQQEPRTRTSNRRRHQSGKRIPPTSLSPLKSSEPLPSPTTLGGSAAKPTSSTAAVDSVPVPSEAECGKEKNACPASAETVPSHQATSTAARFKASDAPKRAQPSLVKDTAALYELLAQTCMGKPSAARYPESDSQYEPTAGVSRGGTQRSRARTSEGNSAKDLVTGTATSPRGQIAALCAGVVAILLLATLLALHPLRRLPHSEVLCHTEECQLHDHLLRQVISTNVDPCEDFHAYVCSRWLPPNVYKDQMKSLMDQLRFGWYRAINISLYEGTKILPAGRKARAMYDRCMDSSGSRYGSNVSEFLEMLPKIGLRWPGEPLPGGTALGLLISMDINWMAPLWFTARVTTFPYSERGILRITAGPHIGALYHHHLTVRQGYAYERYWRAFQKILFGNTAAATSTAEIEDVASIEGDILTRLHKALTLEPKSPAVFSLGDIENYTNPLSSTQWIEQLSKNPQYGRRFGSNDYVFAGDVGFLKAVGSIFATYNDTDIQRHVAWLFVQTYGILAHYDLFRLRYGESRLLHAYLPIICGRYLEGTYKPLLIPLHYVARIPEFERDQVSRVLESLKHAFSGKINASSWIDIESNHQFHRKLSRLETRLWPHSSFLRNDVLEATYANFPDNETSFASYWFKSHYWLRYMKRTPEYEYMALLPDNSSPAYLRYDYLDNSLHIAIGAVARPLFYANGTEAMLYGGFGFSLALQLAQRQQQGKQHRLELTCAKKPDIHPPATTLQQRLDVASYAGTARPAL
ncbi:neprilysin-11-like [Haemaphysalis longicornis]